MTRAAHAARVPPRLYAYLGYVDQVHYYQHTVAESCTLAAQADQCGRLYQHMLQQQTIARDDNIVVFNCNCTTIQPIQAYHAAMKLAVFAEGELTAVHKRTLETDRDKVYVVAAPVASDRPHVLYAMKHGVEELKSAFQRMAETLDSYELLPLKRVLSVAPVDYIDLPDRPYGVA